MGGGTGTGTSVCAGVGTVTSLKKEPLACSVVWEEPLQAATVLRDELS